ncbi:ankyrin repeat-containing protein, partial [Tanacetum coccineum]
MRRTKNITSLVERLSFINTFNRLQGKNIEDGPSLEHHPLASIYRVKVRIKIPAEDGGNEAGLRDLCDATREGNWWRAQSILRKHKIELTKKINDVGETMLHLAVGEGKNYFVQKLLNSRQNEEVLEEKNNKGQTALHIAALVGNKYAAELLVKKRDNLLYVKDNLAKEPLLTAYSNNQISTFAYLLEVTKKAGELLSKDHG